MQHVIVCALILSSATCKSEMVANRTASQSHKSNRMICLPHFFPSFFSLHTSNRVVGVFGHSHHDQSEKQQQKKSNRIGAQRASEWWVQILYFDSLFIRGVTFSILFSCCSIFFFCKWLCVRFDAIKFENKMIYSVGSADVGRRPLLEGDGNLNGDSSWTGQRVTAKHTINIIPLYYKVVFGRWWRGCATGTHESWRRETETGNITCAVCRWKMPRADENSGDRPACTHTHTHNIWANAHDTRATTTVWRKNWTKKKKKMNKLNPNRTEPNEWVHWRIIIVDISND